MNKDIKKILIGEKEELKAKVANGRKDNRRLQG